MIKNRVRSGSWVAVTWAVLTLFSLAGCDPGGRLAQLTPPAATPMVLGLTAEASEGLGGIATAGPEQTEDAGDPPAPLPTPTYDSSRPAWTIFYYAATDNGSASFGWDDLNEMESAGLTDQVRVVAQVDWPADNPTGFDDTVRYLVIPDSDETRLASEAVVSLGEVNMGDPSTLADFLTWGMANYPANRYALILNGFGGGWQGCCLDQITGTIGQSDHLSLPDIDQALAATYSQSGGVKFEVIGFAAGLMSQLDILQTIQPYAGYAAVSAGLMPGSSWDFQAVITQLNANPLVDGQQFAGDLVTAYVNYQRQMAGDEYVGMAAVDLSRIPALTAAVETLALVMAADPEIYGAIGSDAIRGAQRYGAGALTDTGRIASVDLLHAAAIIAESVPAGELQTAASNVAAAVTGSLVAYDHGQGIPYGRGIAIYWPAGPQLMDPAYPQISRLPSWATYLAGPAPAAAPPPRVTMDGGPRQTVSIANPALMRSEVIGQRLDEVVLIADQEAADGRRVIRQYEIVQPALMTMRGGTNTSLWADGRHESLIIWDATASYLSDHAGAGDFFALRPVDPSPLGSPTAINGIFRPDGNTTTEATIVFGINDTASKRLWAAGNSNGSRLIGEVQPVAGNVFQPAVTFLNPDGSLSFEPGIGLIYDESGAVFRSTRPLTSGSYAVGIRATPLGGSPVIETQPLIVDTGGPAVGFRAFIDSNNDVQFLYPAGWLVPVSQEGVTYTSNIDNSAQLQVRYYPNWTADVAALEAEVLGTFGEVSILLQEPIQIGTDPSVEGLRTAYGYESADRGARTGMFLAFVKEGIGYVVDMDASRDDETTSLAIVDTIAANWQFLPVRLGFGPEQWAELAIGEFRLNYPIAYTYQEFNNWHRFTGDGNTFVAARIQASGRTPAEAMAGLLHTASEGVAGFTAEEPERMFFGGHLWERNDFIYTDVTGAIIKGLLLSRQEGNMEIAVWAEAPEPASDLLEVIFLPAAASIERIPTSPSG